MRQRWLGKTTACAVAGWAIVFALSTAAPAQAAGVLVVGLHGHVLVRSDPFLPRARAADVASVGLPQTGATAGSRRGDRRRVAVRSRTSPNRPRTVRATAASLYVPTVLQNLLAQRQISSADYTTDLRIWNKGVAAQGTLSGTPAVEFDEVMATTQALADEGLMTGSRAPEIFMTLWRNRVWWTSGVIPTSGQRIEFSGSGIVWEYYPGQGIQLQVLGTFGKADGLYTAGPTHYTQMLSLVNEMIPLASIRNGALAWEYLFAFENGRAPWTSAMSQGTAIEALTRAAAASRYEDNSAAASNYLSVAHKALAIMTQRPPQGVAVPTTLGTRYVLYSFNPDEQVINGFLQTLIGLYDYAHASGDTQAQALFRSGNAEAKAETPTYDTGSWSLYEPGQEDTLDYHQLVTGFLQSLCQRTSAAAYCTTYQHFTTYLKTPPVLNLLSTTAHSPATGIDFSLSKISHVTVTISDSTKTVYSTTADFGYGHNMFTVPPLSPGAYKISLNAIDLAGNAGQTSGTVTVVSG